MKSNSWNKTEEQRNYKQYLKEVSRYPLLSKQEEESLIKEVKEGSKSAFDKLICSNLRFVIKMAFMYRGQGLPIEDLINEGNIGLIEGAKRFNPGNNVKFMSYAVWWVRQSMTRAIFEKARMVRLSAGNELKIRRMVKHSPRTKQVVGSDGPIIDTDTLAESMGYTNKFTDNLVKMNQKHLSLDTPTFIDSDSSLLDSIISGNFETPDKEVESKSLFKFIGDTMKYLSPKERKVLTFTFGLEANKQLSLSEVGEMFNLSKERIRQIKEEALNKLRNVLTPQEYLSAA